MPPARDTAPAAVAVRLVTPGEVSLAVLPLQDVSADGEESFAREMTDGAHHRSRPPRLGPCRLANIVGDLREGPAAAARDRGAHSVSFFVVEGSVTKGEGRVRIAARLIDARSDEHLLAESYDRPLRQVLTVQAEVAQAIARAIRIALASTPHASPGVASGPRAATHSLLFLDAR